MIRIDTFLRPSITKNICEDYILSGYDPVPYIIISDGCSSSKNTDVGARILCYIAKQYLTSKTIKEVDNIDINEMGEWIIHNSEFVGKALGLNKTALDATLIISLIRNNNCFTFFYGDGFVSSIDGNNKHRLFEVSYSPSMPFYLSYKINKNRLKDYETFNVSQNLISLEDDAIHETIARATYRYRHNSGFIRFRKVILITSDGLNSFKYTIGEKVGDQYDTKILSQQLRNFKTTTGEFLKRRCIREIKDMEKEGILQTDDLAVGAFLFEDDNEVK